MAALNAAAPKITDRLCDACAEHFAAVRAHLDALEVGYRLEPGLVRGLDYYTRTAFEFYVTGREGQQQAIGGGGRYDGLVELLGGRPTPGIGFGIGIDRLILALDETGVRRRSRSRPGGGRGRRRPGRHGRPAAGRHDLRAAGIAARAELGRRKLGKQLEAAARDRRPFRGHRRRRAGGRRGRPARPAGRHPEARRRSADLAREIERSHGAHRHGAPRTPDVAASAEQQATATIVPTTMIAPRRAIGDSRRPTSAPSCPPIVEPIASRMAGPHATGATRMKMIAATR